MKSYISYSVLQRESTRGYTNLKPFKVKWSRIIVLFWLSIMLSIVAAPIETLHAQTSVSDDEICFAIADGYKRDFQGGSSGTDVLDHIARDTLVLLNRRTGETYSVNGEIPNMTTFNVEAMAFAPGGGLLYVADGDQLGTVDLLTADYTALTARFGTGRGYRGTSTTLTTHEFRDVDSLAFDPTTGDLWGTSRTTSTDGGVVSDNPPDILFRIDPSTGSFIPDAFPSPVNTGELVDYLEIDPITDLDLSAMPLADIDDIAIDPIFGVMYAIMNEGGGPSKLVTINMQNGSTSEVANFIRQDTGEQIADMEAISFFNDGQLYGSTGKDWLDGRNVLWQIDKQTAVVDYVGEFTPRLIDFEALGCLAAATYLKLEKSTNGEDADQLPGPLLAEGEAITWRYLVRNTTNTTLTDVQVVDDNGTPDDSSDDIVVCENFDLAPGQSNIDAGITCELTDTAQLIRYTNVGVATAIATDDNGIPFTVRDQDTSNYVGFEPAAVGDFVWLDVNGNGRQDAFEPPVQGVRVELFRENGTLAGTTVTDENGFFIFAQEQPGRYYLEFDLSDTNFTDFTTRGSADPERDSDVFSNPLSPDFGRTEVFTLVDGKYDNTRDAGLISDGVQASIGDFVWLDQNGNGIQDTAADGSLEPGLAGATVELFDTDGTLIGTATTGSDGSYLFDDLPAGDYFLVFSGPAGFLPTAVNMGDDDQLDSDSMIATGQTGLINLSPGERDNSVDAGYFQPGEIVGVVWDDLDGDGIQDPNEPGIPGVTVTLTGPDGSTQTMVTDANGAYNFENLPPGDYSVTFTLPDGRVFSPPGQGSDDTIDSDADPDDGTTNTISLESGGQGEFDGGLFQPVRIIGIVWDDLDGDGIQDANEPGIPGIEVVLVGEDGTLQTDSTDANGEYQFENLPPGDYSVTFTLPDDRIVSPQDQGTDDTIDSDPDPNDGTTDTISLESGGQGEFDAGLFLPGMLTGVVFDDLDGDGIQDSNEPGIPGVEVQLVSELKPEATLTDANGEFKFDDLRPDDYSVVFVLPDGRVFSPQDQGNDDTIDSDADPTDGSTVDVTIPSGGTGELDAGVVSQGSLGDRVFDDLDGDGIQDSNEPGVSGVLVTLIDSQGIQQATDTTDANGLYEFTGLTAGDYTITFARPAGAIFSPQDQGSDDSQDSDVDPDDGRITTTLTAGEDDNSLDAGIIRTTGLGDLVFNDLDGDGIQDSNEPGVAGVEVTLVGQDTTESTTTDSNGRYSFANLTPGNYTVTFVLPAGAIFSPPDQGSDDTRDSDADPDDGTVSVTLAAGEANETIDAGIIRTTGLGDLVFNDLDGDGIQDSNEPGVAGVEVTLVGQGATESTTTDSNGRYSFANLTPGDYTVTFVLPAGAIFSPQDQGSDDSQDSDVDPDNGRITTTLTAGEDDNSLDAGIIRTTGLGDLVFNDLDGDGIQDSNEPGVAGVEVTLVGQDTTESTTTDSNGRYSFANLTPGDYTVTFVLPAGAIFSPQDQGSDDTRDSDADPDDGAVSVTLAAGEANETIDAGIITTISLGDFVFDDLDGDGIQDTNERGVAGVQVKLTDSADVEQNTTTDGAGGYTFANLIPGDYTVTFILPTGTIFSPQDQGGNDSSDSDADPDDGTVSVTLNVGQSDDSIDAGIIRTTGLGDLVFNDLDGDGVQDSNEPGVAGVEVTLVGQGTTESTTTDSNGRYSFANLTPGNYTVTFTLPAGATFSPQNQGSNDSVDSDADPDDGTVSVTLDGGGTDDTIDAGLILEDLSGPASLGDRVWFDQDKDGIQDSNEPGLAGVTVQLLDENNTVVMTTTTDPAGLYSFTELSPGDYAIQVINPIGGTPTEADQGSDDTEDSDIEATADGDAGRSPLTTLDPGEDDPTLDAGYLCTPIVGGLIWEDSDSDGVRDPGEPGLADVFVQIIAESTGQVVANLYTGMDGSFLASDLDEDETYTIDANVPFASRLLIPTTDEPLRGVAPSFCSAPNRIGYGPTQLGVIGDLVWYDANGNGEPDEWLDANGNGVLDRGDPNEWYAPFPFATDTEPESGEFDACGIANVTVILRDDSGAELGRTETNPFGWYTFFNLDEDTYTVDVDTTDPDLVAGAIAIANSGLCVSGTPPVAIPLIRRLSYPYLVRSQEQLPAQVGDLTCRMTTPESITNFLPVDQGPPTDGIDLTFDFGIVCEGNGALGDRVWFDDNGNGLQDEGEPGANAIEVILTDSEGTTRTVFTDPSGQYLFTDLPPGNYTVTFVPPSDLIFTTPNATNDQSPDTSDQTDSDADPADGTTPTITLVAGVNDLTIDAGLLRVASLGDFVWEDSDGDGLQGSNEPGVSTVLVTLTDSQGITQTIITDASGRYEFTNLIPGDYTVTFTLPTGAFWTTPNVTSDQSPETSDQIDSDVNPDDSSVSVTLAPGENNDTIDGGILRRTGLGDFVWRDLDSDGLQDSDEPGVADVTVELLDGAGAVLATTQTDENGQYQFTDLQPNVTYVVRFTPPDGLTFTLLNRGSDDQRDSDVDPATNTTAPITLDSGTFDDSVDAGLADLARLGDRAWEDLDGNGLQDDGEPGISGVTVRLLGSDGEEVASTTTDVSGFYFFTGLAAGQYQVEFTTPDGFSPTVADVAPNGTPDADTIDSDADPITGLTAPIELEAGDIDVTVDAGFYRPATLGDEVWEDLNGDGIRDPDEPALNGVTIQLFREGEDASVGQQTAQDGLYLFENLAPGNYFAIFQPPDGFSFTVQDRGSDDGLDSDANPVSGVTSMVMLNSGDEDRTLDVGLVQLASVGDFVFTDANGNGIQDPGEEGMSGIDISLFNQEGTLIAQTTSGSDGSYSFPNLQPGEYYMAFTRPDGFSFAQPGQGSDPALDSDVDPVSNISTSFVLLSGEINNDIDAGLNPFSTLGDFVWSDINGDGIQGPDESGLGQITLVLYNDDDVAIQQTLTEDDGSYTFDELVPGTYSVVVERPIGFEFTQQDQGSDDDLDSDVDENGASPDVPIGFGETDFSVDAGLRPLAAAIDVEKSTNGVDADEAGTLVLAEDGAITWRYVVSNIGNVELTNIQLVDDQLGAINGTASCPTTTLGVGEMMVCSVTGVAEFGPYVNIATVTGFPAEQPDVPVEDSDSSHYTGVTLNLSIDKSDDVMLAIPGEPLTYTLEYANDGPTTGVDVKIVDDLPAGVTFLEVLEETPAIVEDPLVTLVPDANQRVIWRIPELAANESGKIVFLVNTDPNLANESVTNKVEINCEGVIDAATELARSLLEADQSVTCDNLDSDPSDNQDEELTQFAAPSAINLQSFDVLDGPDGITVEWLTSSEINTSGFRLYRGTTPDFKTAAIVNQDSIAALSEEGGFYVYEDESTLETLPYYYWLVELEDGVEQYPFGPERVRPQSLRYDVFLPMISQDGGSIQ